MSSEQSTSMASLGGEDLGNLEAASRIGLVVIGRNEGDRLRRCLDSLYQVALPVVYVDSGSTDGSAGRARARGVEVVELNPERPFTAARARNAGAHRLESIRPGVEFVQFIDGDCTLSSNWLDAGCAFLRANDCFAAVAGRLRELHPESSIYNRLCQMEWDVPTGETDQSGGIVLVRKHAFDAVGGFREELTAGEEPELCARLKRAGWRIMRLPDEMAVHDADMTRFGQWWTRCRRGGHAAMQGWSSSTLNGWSTSRSIVVRALIWGACFPVAAVALIAILLARRLLAPAAWLMLAAMALTLLRVLRTALIRRRSGVGTAQALAFAAFNAVSKVPEAIGVLEQLVNGLRGRNTALLEYKER